MRDYCREHALMVQPEPEGPTQSALAGEGLEQPRDHEQGVHDQGRELRENVLERGGEVGGAEVVLALSSGAHIESDVHMDELFDAAEPYEKSHSPIHFESF